jgi:hypothetical protein
MLQGLPHLLVAESAGAFHQFVDLVRRCECELAREWRFEIVFEELAVPPVAGEVVEVDAVGWGWGRGGGAARAVAFAEGVAGIVGYAGLASAADFASQPHSRRGRSFPTHRPPPGMIIGERNTQVIHR